MKCKSKYTVDIHGMNKSKIFRVYEHKVYNYNIKNGSYNINIDKRTVCINRSIFNSYFIKI